MVSVILVLLCKGASGAAETQRCDDGQLDWFSYFVDDSVE